MGSIKGVFPPVVTLFREEGSFDYEANEKHTDFLIEKGVSGLAYLGTSGEFSVLGLLEKKEFIRKMTNYVNHRVKVIVGVGSTCLAETIELLRCAEEAGVDGVLLVNPYFSIYDPTMVEAYFDKVVGNTDIPVFIYNIPELTGFDFSYELIERLARKHKNLAGIKDTTTDLDHIRKIIGIKKIKPDFSVFCAYEDQGIEALQAGVDGFINATANFAPEFTVGLYRAFQEGDEKNIKASYANMCQAMEIYGFSQPLFLACKEAVYQRSVQKSCFERLPAVALNENTKAAITDKLKIMGVL